MKSRTKLIAAISASLLAGLALALLAALVFDVPLVTASSSTSVEHAGHDHEDHSTGDSGSETYYTCPMHPDVVSDSPGACPVCGMDLVQKTRSSTGMDPQELARMGRVSLSPTQRVLANVQTTEARPLDTASEIRAVGIVAYDETGLATIPSWVDGRIQKLYVQETGAVVQKDQPVMRVYSPALLTAQEEHLLARKSRYGGASLAKQTRKRLELLGMSDAQIKELERTKNAQEYVDVSAPNAGTITDLKVRQGQYVEEGAPLFDIADLSTVWVEAEVHEDQLAAVSEGMSVRVQADAFPGQSLQGTVTLIHPVVESDTRTAKIRVEIENTDGQPTALKPGMYASVFFQKTGAGPAKSSLAVPKSAVIRGGQKNHVFVEVEENVFERREVELAEATDDFLVVRSGVEAGEPIAHHGGFLLDSEVQLNSFGASDGHEGMDMGESGDDEHGDQAVQDAEHGDISADDIPKEGKHFDPMIPVEAVPDGMWTCDMNGKTHWIQHEKGDGTCPDCGMPLVQKGAE